jgi:hypothetical protein
VFLFFKKTTNNSMQLLIFEELHLLKNKTMKKIVYLIALLTSCTAAYSQNFQYIKNGGSSNTGDDLKEDAIDIAVDSQRNSYVLSYIHKSGATISGLPISIYAHPSSGIPDFVLVSYSCDGTYRWHKG